MARTEPADALTYFDAVNFMRDHRAPLQSALYSIAPTIYADDATRKPRVLPGHAVYSQFFRMLDVPFLYGSFWSEADDERHTPVIVISNSLNEQLFKGANSIGKKLRLNTNSYQIVGVLSDWNPQPQFYDLTNRNAFGAADQVFIPFSTAIDQQMPPDGGVICGGGKLPDPGFAGMLTSTCAWIGYMLELDTAEQVKAYRNYLDAYANDQRSAGRFSWPARNRLRNLPEWLSHKQVTPPEAKVSMVVSLFMLIVCLVNTIGVLLAKFLRRSREIGVRRALGARRAAIAFQFGVESGVVGLAGGTLGIFLTWFGVRMMRDILPRHIAVLVNIDLSLLCETLLLAIVATVLAGLYPTWRAAHVRPALLLKS